MEIKINNLSVVIDKKEIIKNIAIDLQHKDFVGIIGPNGSGKSTILKTVYRSLKKTKGEIFFDGIPFEQINIKDSAKKLGVMAQVTQMSFDFTVIDLVLMGRNPHKNSMELDNEEDYKIALEALNKVGMSKFEKQSFNLLSSGEQQRVLMARVLTGQPETIILDELTNHLDIYYQFKILNLVKSMNVEVLAVMHDLNLAARYCNKLYVMQNGSVVAAGKPEAVLQPQLLREVFRIQSDIKRDSDGFLNIQFKDVD